MRIAIVGPAYPYRGGIADFNERIAKAYIERGEQVQIETFTLQYPSFLFPGKTQFSSGPYPDGLDIQRTINTVNPLNWIRVGRRLKNARYDLVIVKYWLPFIAPCLGTICRIIKQNKYSKVISILDNIVPHEKRPGDRLLSSYFVNSIDAFVAMSHSVMSDLKTFDQLKPALFSPHPVYDNFGEKLEKNEAKDLLGLKREVSYLLFFGFIRDYKGLDLLVKAMKYVKLTFPDLRLIIAGEYYGNQEKYESLYREEGVEDMLVMHTDFIPDEKVGAYFSAADVVVQTYKTATQSGVTQIAYNFDKPMIVTNVGGLAEIVPHGKVGYVVDVSPKAIADAIVSFYKEKKEEEFVQNVASEKYKYSWGYMLESVDKLLEMLKKDS